MSLIIMTMAMAMGQAAQPSPPAQRPRMDRRQRMERMFTEADTDRNGQVSRAEMMAAGDRMHAGREKRMGMRRGGMRPDGMRGPGMRGADMEGRPHRPQ